MKKTPEAKSNNARVQTAKQRSKSVIRKKNALALTPAKVWKTLFKIFQFGQVVVDDIGIFGIVLQIVLVVALGLVKCLERLDFCDNLPRINFRGVQLRYVSLSDTLLIFVRVEDI